jgi:hypothetical protein
MSDRLLKSWTRVPLIVDRRDGIPFRIPSGCAKSASPALRTSINITKSRLTASLSTGRRSATCQVQQSGTPFTDFPDMPSCDVSLRPDVGVSPRFKDQVHESKENQRCRNLCEDLHFPRCPVSHSRENDSRFVRFHCLTITPIRFCFRRHAHARKRTRQYAIVIIASIERPSSHEAVAQISPRRTRQPGRANQLGRWP